MIFEKLRKILSEQLDIDESNITMNSHIGDDLGVADSLDVVELVMSVEDGFGITIPDDQIRDLATVGDVVELVEKLVDG